MVMLYLFMDDIILNILIKFYFKEHNGDSYYKIYIIITEKISFFKLFSYFF